jgi:hypothetical protein
MPNEHSLQPGSLRFSWNLASSLNFISLCLMVIQQCLKNCIKKSHFLHDNLLKNYGSMQLHTAGTPVIQFHCIVEYI